jgi:hypothetical protein
MKELQRELRAFPAGRRREMLDEVREHIAQARAELDSESEAAIRTLLDRLGEPSDIAASARERFGVRPARAGVLETVAVIALMVPFIGWLVGTILLWMSRVWTTRDKVIGTIAVPGLWLLVLISSVAVRVEHGVSVSSSAGPAMPPPLEPSGMERFFNLLLGFIFPLGAIVIPLATVIYLVVRARNLSDAAAETI